MEHKGNFLKLWEIAALVSLCLALCGATWAQGRQNGLREDILRLHVVAVSDAPEEQALKLRVRDRVLDFVEPLLADAEDSQQAQQILEANLEGLGRAAQGAAEGRKVTVSLREESYPTRNYEGIRLPAGRYRSLRVVLGEGQGKNWWCVVFPPVCPGAVQTQELEGKLEERELYLITESEDYELRFALVELWGKVITMKNAPRQ